MLRFWNHVLPALLLGCLVTGANVALKVDAGTHESPFYL